MLSIPEFHTLTKQQMFDMSLAHVGKTRQKSVKPDSASFCIYSGIGCAASVFLTPEGCHEADELSRSGWEDMARNHLVPTHEQPFVSSLQRCHDVAKVERFMEDYTENMRLLGLDNSLNLDKLIEIEYSL